MYRYHCQTSSVIVGCLIFAHQPGCQSNKATEDDTEGERETGTSTNAGNDETEDDSSSGDAETADYYQIVYGFEDGDYGVKRELYTYTATTCENENFRLNEEVYPFIWIIVGFHDEYDLIGTHDPWVAEDGYITGFIGRYSDHKYIEGGGAWDQYIVAESGTVTVSDAGDDKYKIEYDIVFNSEVHEIGEMIVTPCDSPYYDF